MAFLTASPCGADAGNAPKRTAKGMIVLCIAGDAVARLITTSPSARWLSVMLLTQVSADGPPLRILARMELSFSLYLYGHKFSYISDIDLPLDASQKCASDMLIDAAIEHVSSIHEGSERNSRASLRWI